MKPQLWRFNATVNKWDKIAYFCCFIALLTLIFTLVCVVIIREIPAISSTVMPISFIALGLLVVEYIVMQIMFDLSKQHNKALLKEAERAQAEKHLRIPKHYKIGDVGQIVELKKPRKRNKNPHQR